MNEFVQTRSVFNDLTGVLYDINEVSGVEPTERYTYVYEQHTQEIDHIFVSSAIARRGTEVEHVHVNTWAASTSERASDHDPTVARVRVCSHDALQGGFLIRSIKALICVLMYSHDSSLGISGFFSNSTCSIILSARQTLTNVGNGPIKPCTVLAVELNVQTSKSSLTELNTNPRELHG